MLSSPLWRPTCDLLVACHCLTAKRRRCSSRFWTRLCCGIKGQATEQTTLFRVETAEQTKDDAFEGFHSRASYTSKLCCTSTTGGARRSPRCCSSRWLV